jgi:hypothetical protein
MRRDGNGLVTKLQRALTAAVAKRGKTPVYSGSIGGPNPHFIETRHLLVRQPLPVTRHSGSSSQA